MGGVCYLIGIILAGYAGYNGFQWYFIFISALIMAIGYSIIRAPQMHGAASRDGAKAIPQLLFFPDYSIFNDNRSNLFRCIIFQLN